MKKYHLTKKAFEDLSDIWTYTFNNWSEEQADKYYSILTDAITEISADRICSSLVIRILHCSMDIKRHLLYQ